MNPQLAKLQRYPFERLALLKAGVQPPERLSHINLSIGEPRHPAPEFIYQVIKDNLEGLSKYPATVGSIALRTAIANWIGRRFHIAAELIDPERHVLPVTGTREALFSFAQCIVDISQKEQPLVLMPNPFYQIYEGAALLAGAQPYYINCLRSTNWMPDFESVPDSIWERCQLLYVCSPGNPTGVVLSHETLQRLIERADKYNFIIASDECYSEIYFDDLAPPPGLLAVAAGAGNAGFERCLVFHSLSKRSSLPGMRSGFVAGDAGILEQYRLYRTYHGCAMSPTFQAASAAAWSDEQHVIANRELYRRKFDSVLEILQPVMDVRRPDAGFYLWTRTDRRGERCADDEFARRLFEQFNLTVLPGSYLGRFKSGFNPGCGHMRMALVPAEGETVEAAERLREFVTGGNKL